MIAIIDYGAGNVTSVQRALARVGFDTEITSDKAKLLSADKVIFPGVGAAGQAMERLNSGGLDLVLKKIVMQGTPLLGICLGLQVLFDRSEEDGGVECLGILPGIVTKFNFDAQQSGFKVPHMGWNQVGISRTNPAAWLFEGIEDESWFYFVHSYFVQPDDAGLVLGKTDYGSNFVSAVGCSNVFGVQFHPEKSGEVGLKLLRNFCERRA